MNYKLRENTQGAGAVSVDGVKAAEYGRGIDHKTVLTFVGLELSVNDPSAAAHVTVKLYDFPVGAILTVGAVANLILTAGAGGISDTFEGDFAVGTAGTIDSTLSGAEVDILPSTPIAAAVAGVGAAKGQSTAVEATVKDGTATAKDLYLNLVIDDAAISADDTLTLTGTITIHWVNLGDY